MRNLIHFQRSETEMYGAKQINLWTSSLKQSCAETRGGHNYLRHQFFVLLSIQLFLFNVGKAMAAEQECTIKPADKPLPKLFSKNHTDLPTVSKSFTISSPESKECSLNFLDILSEYETLSKETLGIFLNCSGLSDIRVYSNVTLESLYNHEHIETTQLHLDGCSFRLEVDLSYFNVHVLYFKPGRLFLPKAYRHAFESLRALIVMHENLSSLSEIFNCLRNSTHLAELVIVNISLDSFPSKIIEQFPNLQTLIAPYNHLTRPPAFPWTNTEMTLPDNLQRTSYFQDRYSKSRHLKIAPNIFFRNMNLDYNKIVDLSNYEFQGYLHVLSVSGNGLAQVGPTTFINITGLQSLILSNNTLNELLENVLVGQKTLLSLDLSFNQLGMSPMRLFEHTVNLEYFDISHNKVMFLYEPTFQSLDNLIVIKLGYNNLKAIGPYVLPGNSAVLRDIRLEFNPITSIPGDVFYSRSSNTLDLQNTSINLDSLGQFLDQIKFELLFAALSKNAVGSVLLKSPKFLNKFSKTIDLSYANVTFINLDYIDKDRTDILKWFLYIFKLKVKGNRIICDSKIVSLLHFMEQMRDEDLFDGSEYFWNDWLCAAPFELKYRPLLTMTENDTYYQISNKNCPENCTCYSRYYNTTTIVDCRARGLTQLPNVVPNDTYIELLLQNNSISTADWRAYFPTLKVLGLNYNTISCIEEFAIGNLTTIEEILLDHNYLRDLPSSLQQIHPDLVTINANSFQCNCKTLWMKRWILTSKSVQDKQEILCEDEKGQAQILIGVPDSTFVCHDYVQSVQVQIITKIAVSCVMSVILLIVLILLMYIFRFEIKVLLHVYYGLRPFGKDEAVHRLAFDAVVFHTESMQKWVDTAIVQPMEKQGYDFKILSSRKDFIAGYSLQANWTLSLENSRRVIFVLSNDLDVNESDFKLAWTIALERIKKYQVNFAIFLNYGVKLASINDRELLKYLRNVKCIDVKESLFEQKLEYSLARSSTYRKNVTKYCTPTEFVNLFPVLNAAMQYDLFVHYSDRDLQFVLHNLKPKLESDGLRLCLADRDFLPGTAVEENVLTSIDRSSRTLFLLLPDDCSMFIFRVAFDRVLKDSCNRLIVALLDDPRDCNLSDELRDYLRRYVHLEVNGDNFWQRLNQVVRRQISEVEST